MKKIIAATGIVMVLLSGCGANNDGNTKNLIPWFTDTEVRVTSNYGHLYDIIRDGNGWLYYARTDGALEPVRDSWGLHTKDISVLGTVQTN